MKKFQEPEINVVKFGVEDVITTSDPENPDNGGGWG